MRVIAGDFRGKRLFAPAGSKIRPTSDMVKESIFNIIASDIPQAVVIDGFAGSGSLGLEALSRGAHKVYFIDNDNQSIALIRKNIEHCRMTDRSEVVFGSFELAAGSIGSRADVILLDPPYARALLPQALQLICDRELLADGGVIAAEHPKEQSLADVFTPSQGGGACLSRSKEKKYGNICVSIYEKNFISGDV